jgi:hypothetical protein|tara:strand:- start:2105 stop:2344 length:240 start_codon:yes stop_codon:yes gene_type:complete
MEMDGLTFWNIIVTLVIAPIVYNIKTNATELKRVDILLNKTREEIAKDYVTKSELTVSIDRVIDRLDRLDEKIDKLVTG